MRFLCDVHISFKIKNFLVYSGCECGHVNEILQGDLTSDHNIATYCNEHDLILISKDQDFTDSYFLRRLPQKFIKISLGNISTNQLIDLIKTTLPIIEELQTRDHFMIEIHKHSIQISED